MVYNFRMYSNDLKEKILKVIKENKLTNSQISKLFKISRKTIYNWRKKCVSNCFKTRKVRISLNIKNFVEKFVIEQINFSYKKLILTINKKFNITISKSTIYNILAERKIRKKNFTRNSY